MAPACVLCVFVFFWTVASKLWFCVFFYNPWEKLPRHVFYVFLCFFNCWFMIIIVWAGYSCINTVLVFLWYCDVGWVNIYRRGSTKDLYWGGTCWTDLFCKSSLTPTHWHSHPPANHRSGDFLGLTNRNCLYKIKISTRVVWYLSWPTTHFCCILLDSHFRLHK